MRRITLTIIAAAIAAVVGVMPAGATPPPSLPAPAVIHAAPNTVVTAQLADGTTVTVTNRVTPVSGAAAAAANQALAHDEAQSPPPSTSPTASASAVKSARIVRVTKIGPSLSAHAATTNYSYSGTNIRICSPVACAFWNQTTYSYGVWFNGYQAWLGGSNYIDPWHYSTFGYALAILGDYYTGNYPVAYATSCWCQYIGVHTSMVISPVILNSPGSVTHWTEMRFFWNGYVDYLIY